MDYRINVSQYGEIAGVYSELAQNCANALIKFHSEIEENCSKCKYQPMVDFVNQISDFYDGEFKTHLMNEFENWERSEYSLDNLLRKIGAGDGAVSEGKKYMDKIRADLESLFSGGYLPKISMDTSQPEIDDQTILANTGYINEFKNSVNDALDAAQKRVDGYAAENNAFYCIVGIVNTLGKSIIQCFDNMIAQVKHGDELFNTNSGESIGQANEDMGDVIAADGSMIWPFDDTFI